MKSVIALTKFKKLVKNLDQTKKGFNTLITPKLKRITRKPFLEALKHIYAVALALVRRFRFQQFYCFSTCNQWDCKKGLPFLSYSSN